LPVQVFLLRLKKVWQRPDRVTLVRREKNITSMSELELSMADIRRMCLQLVPADRAAGPSPDDKGRPGQVCVFHPVYRGTKMYLKVSLNVVDGTDFLTVISCHREGRG
jgi:hypothetical protein